MPRGKRVLKEVAEEAKQTKKVKKPSARTTRSNKKMEDDVKKPTTKKRKTKAEGIIDLCIGQSSCNIYYDFAVSCTSNNAATDTVDTDLPPTKRAKAPAVNNDMVEAVEGKK